MTSCKGSRGIKKSPLEPFFSVFLELPLLYKANRTFKIKMEESIMTMRKSLKILLITLMLLGFASCASLRSAAVPTWPIPEGIKTVDVNGYPLAYREAGSGTPLVLLHMHPADYRSWDSQVPDFSKKYRTIAVSLRHYYPERWNGVGDDFTIAQHASDIAVMIKKLNLGKVHLVGHSRGGPVALTVAKLYPELIRSLIFPEPNMEPIMPETPEKEKRMAGAKARGEKVRANLALGDNEKAAREWFDSAVAPGAWGKAPDRVKQNLLDNVGALTDVGERGKFSCADIKELNFPILLLNGEKSPKLFSEYIAAMRKCKPEIPAALIVPSAGHSMNRENPAFFNKAILDFLEQH
jgi:pimeloyl-ACP methyl ester carboxylesterase